jgi:CBS domain-containing protein
LPDAAKKLAQHRLHGAPVIDADGRCVGVLSVSDLARWTVNRDSPPPPLPRTCQNQEKLREIGGEVTLCLLACGACPIQQPHVKTDRTTVIACSSPHSVPVDWQFVEMEPLPQEDVKHYMTSGAATAALDAPITELAKRMTDCRIQRIVIIDDQNRPAGIVSISDIIAAVAATSSHKNFEIQL